MYNVDYKDTLAGFMVMAIGAFVAIYAYINLDLGTLQQMQPGTVPFGLGVLLVSLGAMILITGLRGVGPMPSVEWKHYLLVVTSLASFAILVEPLGLVVAILALVVVSSFASPISRLGQTLALAAVLSILCAVVFVFGLGLPFNLLPQWK